MILYHKRFLLGGYEMSGMLLTKDTTFIIGPVAEILGLIMNAIFNFLNLIIFKKFTGKFQM